MADNSQALTTFSSRDAGIAIFEPQNVQTIAALAPKSYEENSLSHLRCLEAGHSLLDRVKHEGMSDALDTDIAKFIEKAKLTVKKMNGKRTPVTQLFDQIRKVFTSMENDVDPAKADSIPNQLQQARNAYAKKKHEQEERRRRQEAARLAKENAKNKYRADVEDDYLRQFNALVNKHVNELTDLDRQVSLDNYNDMAARIKAYNCELPTDWCQIMVSGVYPPTELTPDECCAIQANVMAGLVNRFHEQFLFEMESNRDDILDRLPSKKRELERIEKASAEEAERIIAEMKAREDAEAARKEKERQEREAEQQAAALLQASKDEMDSLFGLQVAQSVGYQSKAQVKQKVVVATPQDIMAIVGFWWSQEGQYKTVDELSKEFKKQINFANAAANSKDNPIFINNVNYTVDVKAK